MTISSRFAASVGRLFRNLIDHKWYIAEAEKQVISTVVVNPIGNRVNAYLRAHLYDSDDRHIGDAYKCRDGHEYLKTHDRIYVYDPSTDSFKVAS
jgi:hypothetical protein